MNGSRMRALLVALLVVVMLGASACSDDGGTTSSSPTDRQTGDVDTNQFEGLLTECEIVTPKQISDALGGGTVERGFQGAICRWVVSGATVTDLTLAWYEWGDLNLEKKVAKEHGYETENELINGVAGFTARDPQRPAVCGVTAKSPGRGTLTWWTEPHGAPAGDPCEAATKLMELVISRAH